MSRHLQYALALGLAAATLLVYAPVLDNRFVDYDDELYIVNDVEVGRGLTPDSVAWAFSTFRGANWFPLTRLSWMLDVQLFGLDPGAFHRTSLLLHAAAASVLLLALARMSGALWPSVFVAGVFALHPLHVESVAWASARKDVLSGLFAMLTLLAYERYARRGGRARYAAVFACLALGLMAKPTLVTLPFVLLLLDVWPLRRVVDAAGSWDFARVRAAVVEKLPLIALSALFSAITVASQRSWGAVQTLELLPPGMRVSNALVATLRYVGKAFWPSDLAVFYPHPRDALPSWQIAGAAALLAGVTWLALRELRRRPYIAVGWLWFVGMLVPVIGIVQVGQAAMADRYTYLPLIGLSLIPAFGAASIPRARVPVLVAGGVALVALSVATFQQARLWHDTFSLFRHAQSVTTDNHVAYINIGIEHYRVGSLDEAAEQLKQALRLVPRSATAQGAMGDVLLAQGRTAPAIRHYRRALVREPQSARWHSGLGNALLQNGRREQAVDEYRTAIELQETLAEAHANLGLALAELGHHAEALPHFETALELEPDDARVRGNFGVTLKSAGDSARARAEFERALALDADLAVVHAHLGSALAEEGDLDGAISHLATARRLEPEVASYAFVLGQFLERTGRPDEALGHYRAAAAAWRAGGRAAEAARAQRRARALSEPRP